MFPCYRGVALRGGPRRLKQILPVAALAVALLLPGHTKADSPGASAAPLWLRYPAISPDGKSIAFSFEGHIFVVPSAGGVARPLTVGPAHDTAPVWSPDGKLIAFASDQYGHFNVFLASLEGGPVRRLTTYSTDAIPSGFTPDGKYVVFNGHCMQSVKSSQLPMYALVHGAGLPELYKVSIEAGHEPEMILTTAALNSQFDKAGQRLLYEDNKSYDVYATSVEFGETKRITNTPGQERNISFSYDGRKLLFAAEYNQPWSLYEASIVQPKDKEPYFFNSTIIDVHPLLENEQENFLPKYSPDGTEVAFIENRAAIKVLNLASKETRLVLSSDRNYSYSDDDLWFDWSADGKWIVTPFLQNGRWSYEVGLVDATGKQPITNLTKSGYQNSQPLWAKTGASMIFLSDRYGLHGDDGNGGDPQYDVYETFFTQEAFNRFRLSPVAYEILKANEEKAKKKKDEDKSAQAKASAAKEDDDNRPAKVEPLALDLDKIEDRTTRLTLAPSRIVCAALSKDGEQLVYLAKSDKGFAVWLLKPRKKELKQLCEIEGASKPAASLPQQLFLDQEDKAAFVLVDGHINKIDLATAKIEPVKFDAEKEIDGAAERSYLFEHIWRQIKEKFYVPDMHGVPWDYYKTVYARFLPFITDDRDFAEMASEMLGELNASHTGCYLTPITDGDQTASLGAFFDPSYNGSGIKIEEVIEKGPLTETDPPLQVGMIIEKIDGQPVNSSMDISPLLNFKAGKPTALSIFDPVKNSRVVVTVKPVGIGVLEGLLYDRWVKQRRELVDKLSNGTIGYVHVARMADPAYRDTLAEALGRQVEKKGLIVDTRWNPGGNMHEALETFLSGKQYIKFVPRGQILGWEPLRKWSRKTALLINEGNYSDGLIFPWTYKHFQLGKLIGMPVSDSGSFVWWETLQDPGLIFGIPEVGLQDEQGEFLERMQVDPDIQVTNDPKSTAEGRDPQLERAVQELMSES